MGTERPVGLADVRVRFEILRVGGAGCDDHGVLRSEEPVGVEQRDELPEQEPVALGGNLVGVRHYDLDGLAQACERHPYQPIVADLTDGARLDRVGRDQQEPLVVVLALESL